MGDERVKAAPDLMQTTFGKFPLRRLLSLLALSTCLGGGQLHGQASKPRVNNEKPEKGKQSKRIHPHALKLILQGKNKEAISYLSSTASKGVNPGHTKMLLDLAEGKPGAWKFDAKSWPMIRSCFCASGTSSSDGLGGGA